MTKSDPYAASNPKPATSADTVPELQHFLGRLDQLGATPDELAGVAASWDDLEPADPANPEAWTLERRTAMVSANDADLVEMIDSARQEYAEGTTTEAEADQAATNTRQAELWAEATEATAGTVAEALDWVGDDPQRAGAALAVETGPDGRNRVTLVRPLSDLVAATPPAELV